MATFSGTAGADTFVYAQRGFRFDTINRFEIGKDKIDLSAFHVADLTTLRPYMAQVGADVVISLGFGFRREESITLTDASLTQLLKSPESFILNQLPAALTVNGDSSEEKLFGGNGNDKLLGYSGDDELNGGKGNDQLTGGTGTDLLRGGAGNDRFIFDDRGFGNDTITDFEIGKDRIDLSAFNIADLTTLRPYMAQVGADVVISLGFGFRREESITLTDADLTQLLKSPKSFIFNNLPDALTVNGGSTDEKLFGGKGNDKLFGYRDNDELNGGEGNDQLTGGTGDDLLRGGAGNDRFIFDDRGFGNDTIADFEIGKDRIDLSAFNIADLTTLRPYMAQVGADVVISLGFGFRREESITLTDADLTQLLKSPKSFIFNNFPDALTVNGDSTDEKLFGGKGNDKLFGYRDNDELNGGKGNDQLTGGTGNDLLRGGAGADTFFFFAGDGYDVIADFNGRKGDVINLASIDPGTAPGDQKLALITGNVFTGAGQVLIEKQPDHYTVYVNLDGNLNDAELAIDVYSPRALTADDFVL